MTPLAILERAIETGNNTENPSVQCVNGPWCVRCFTANARTSFDLENRLPLTELDDVQLEVNRACVKAGDEGIKHPDKTSMLRILVRALVIVQLPAIRKWMAQNNHRLGQSVPTIYHKLTIVKKIQEEEYKKDETVRDACCLILGVKLMEEIVADLENEE